MSKENKTTAKKASSGKRLTDLTFIRIPAKVIKNIRRKGLTYTLKKIRSIFKMRKFVLKSEDEALKGGPVKGDILFSIIVPLYNTPPVFLKEMIDSVRWQTYENWELCLADGSDTEHSYVGEYCKSLAEEDSRIKYKLLEVNYGIAGNTNAAMEMASGDFLALFDHDDRLHPAALAEMARAARGGADFIYTDEAKFLKNERKDAYDCFFKPDFSPDMLRSCNYICHFSAFSRELYGEVGGFRSDFDGSQDYDIILRLTEKAKKVVHIPKILYFWRCHAASVASNIAAKPYCIISAHKALDEHLKRVGLRGAVEDSSYLSTYKMNYETSPDARLSFIVTAEGGGGRLSECLDAIYSRSGLPTAPQVIVVSDGVESTQSAVGRAKEKYPAIITASKSDKAGYASLCNLGASLADGEYLVFVSSDAVLTSRGFANEMLMFAQREDVAAVGISIYRKDKTAEHCGVILGIDGACGYSHRGFPYDDVGFFCRMTYVQNYSAVASLVMAVRSEVYKKLGGFSEELDTLCDVDFCIRATKNGYKNVFTPYARACNFGKPRLTLGKIPEKEKESFRKIHADVLESYDPYYNPNLTLLSEDFSIGNLLY